MSQSDPLVGILTPMQRDGAADFATGSGADLSSSKIRFVLGTQIGELPWRTAFGSTIPGMKFASNTRTLEYVAKTSAIDALAAWAPKVRITGVQAHRRDTTLAIRVSYTEEGEDRATSLDLFDQ